MTIRTISILLALGLGGCATSAAKTLPVCDGQHRRPANPYGSVLDAAPATAAATPAPSPQTAPPPAAAPAPSECGA